MFAQSGIMEHPRGVQNLLKRQDELSWMVVESINESQELAMLNDFSQQSNKMIFQKCLEERIAEIKSWQWVLKDLSKRLADAIDGLKHEENAIQVIVERLNDEIDMRSNSVTKPGALGPFSDPVEESIYEENKYLKHQRKLFESILSNLKKEIVVAQKIKKKIESDVNRKQKTIDIEESVIDSSGDSDQTPTKSKKKNRTSPLPQWEGQCNNLKCMGLQALANAIVHKQQIRGARTQLSIGAQAHASRVDVALRRRHHASRVKLEELKWQKEEALKDIKILDEELLETEKNIIKNMNKIPSIEAKIIERTQRPSGEQTRDNVNKSLRTEITTLKTFNKGLRVNIKRINCLKNTLFKSIEKIDGYIADLSHLKELDKSRILGRLGTHEGGSQGQQSRDGQPDVRVQTITVPNISPVHSSRGTETQQTTSSPVTTGYLPIIREEDETNETNETNETYEINEETVQSNNTEPTTAATGDESGDETSDDDYPLDY